VDVNKNLIVAVIARADLKSGIISYSSCHHFSIAKGVRHRDYKGKILLVRINYIKDAKRRECVIEELKWY
jgi:hypothetical protein